ncbi:cytochrome P450 [Croceiramulus getboli]|nr:cytochrome P450 [Flavobacteriaceae bacterium YJPT1-3]
MTATRIPNVSMFRFLTRAGGILKNPLPFHKEKFESLGDTFSVQITPFETIIFTRSPGLAEHVLQKNQRNYEKSPIQTKDLSKYIGHGLLTANGELWKKQRKLIQPAFHKKQLVQLLDTMQQAVVAELDKIVVNEERDIFPIFNDLAFQTVVKSLFSSAAGEEEINRLQYITESAQRMLVKELRQPFKKWWFDWGGAIDRTLALTKEARQILKDIVNARKESGERQGDLLDMLLDARYEDGSAIAEEQLIDEILILFTAGHETTSNALTFTCELLARNQEAQQRIYEEVTEAGNKELSLMELIQQCTYTKQVLEESMRLYPPAYFIDRISLEDDEFEGFKIPKGTNVLLSCYEIHRHPDYWEEPERFDPARFDPENKMTYANYYYPFGAGPRMCIGNNFAMYEMILAIAAIMRRFSITPKDSPISIKPLITLKPKEARLEFIPRA